MPQQTRAMSDVLFDRVRSDILALDLVPDTPLRLPMLSERYGVSLTPLRECLNKLCGDQLVVPEHNKGFRVAPLARADLLDLESSRNAIDGAMFVNACQSGDEAWEAGVVGAFHHLSQTPVPSVLLDDAELSTWTRRHKAFHTALIAGLPSGWMHRFSQQLEDQLGRYHLFIQIGLRDLAQTSQSVANQAADIFATSMALEPHRRLYDAALGRDPKAAQQAFDDHTGLSIAAFEDLLELLPKNIPLVKVLGTHAEMTL